MRNVGQSVCHTCILPGCLKLFLTKIWFGHTSTKTEFLTQDEDGKPVSSSEIA